MSVQAAKQSNFEKAQLQNRYRLGILVLCEVLGLAIAIGLVPFAVLLDTTVFSTTVSEGLLTEFLQGCLIASTVLAYGCAIWHFPAARGYLMAGTSLFACMLIREHDAVLDQISHGFWAYPAVAVALFGGWQAWRHRATLAAPLLRHLETRQAAYVLIGLIVLLVFSRLFGTSGLWEGVMGDAYMSSVKTAVQEGIELMAYVLIALGAFSSLATDFGQADAGVFDA